MYERYFQHFNKRAPITGEEREFITNYLTVKKFVSGNTCYKKVMCAKLSLL